MATVLEIRDKESRSEYPLESYGQGSSWRYTSRRSFLVNTSSAEAAKVDAGIPQYGAAHPNDATLFVNSISARSHGSAADWMRVDVDYGRLGETSPEDEPAEWSYTSVTTERPMYEDANNAAMINAVGDPLNLMKPWTDVLLSYSSNIASYDGTWFWTYVNHVNSDTINKPGLYAPVKTALIKQLTIQSRTRNNVLYYRRTIDIMFRHNVILGVERGWTEAVPQMSTNLLKGTESVQGTDYNGYPVTTPRRINATGTAFLTKDQPTVYKFVDIYPAVSFAPIGL